MSNSFNISVKPEIAAAVAKIDAIDAVVDAIRGTDVVNLASLIANNAVAIEVIHANDIPGTNAKVELNLAAIDIIDGIADAIKLKTDLIPQNVRGKHYLAFLTHNTTSLADVVNITGSHGKLYQLMLKNVPDVTSSRIIVTLDGTACQNYDCTTEDTLLSIHPRLHAASGNQMFLTQDSVTLVDWNMEFENSLRIQVKINVGTGSVQCAALYTLDDF